MLSYFEDGCVGPLCRCDHTHFCIPLATTKNTSKDNIEIDIVLIVCVWSNLNIDFLDS